MRQAASQAEQPSSTNHFPAGPRVGSSRSDAPGSYDPAFGTCSPEHNGYTEGISDSTDMIQVPPASTRRSVGPVIVRRATDFDAIISTCTAKLEANPRLLRALMLRAQAHLRKGGGKCKPNGDATDLLFPCKGLSWCWS